MSDSIKDANKVNSDFAYIQDASGEGGDLAQAVELCDALNQALTQSLDSIFSSDVMDSFDASCNTCRHFQRKPMTPEEKRERNIFGMPGHCAKKDIAVRGWQRGQYCGFENAACYENRRTGMRPAEACRVQDQAVEEGGIV